MNKMEKELTHALVQLNFPSPSATTHAYMIMPFAFANTVGPVVTSVVLACSFPCLCSPGKGCRPLISALICAMFYVRQTSSSIPVADLDDEHRGKSAAEAASLSECDLQPRDEGSSRSDASFARSASAC